MRFCTSINCMDGRVQLPVIKYLQNRYNVEYVDSITEPGPNLILSKQDNSLLVDSILNRLEISVLKHKSELIAITGHYDCAGNPALKNEQIEHVKKSIKFIRQQYENIKIIGLWVDDLWEVTDISEI